MGDTYVTHPGYTEKKNIPLVTTFANPEVLRVHMIHNHLLI